MYLEGSALALLAGSPQKATGAAATKATGTPRVEGRALRLSRSSATMQARYSGGGGLLGPVHSSTWWPAAISSALPGPMAAAV